MTTIQVERWIDVLVHGDSQTVQQARSELIEHSRRRMELLCRKMLFGSLHAQAVVDWEDVYQEAALRLWKSLIEVRPASVREFFGLAATQIRRVMLDMSRKYQKVLPPADEVTLGTFDPAKLVQWTEFHEQVEGLAPDVREVFELLWYHELTQREAAEMLSVDESTVKRRFRKAKLTLASELF